MRNIFLALILLVFAGQLQAESSSFEKCKSLLTDNFSEEGSFHTIDLDKIYFNFKLSPYDLEDVQYAQKVLKIYLEQELGCYQGVVDFSQGPFGQSSHSCEYVNEDNPASLVCYVESNLGYFITNINFMEEMRVIYNRWD